MLTSRCAAIALAQSPRPTLAASVHTVARLARGANVSPIWRARGETHSERQTHSRQPHPAPDRNDCSRKVIETRVVLIAQLSNGSCRLFAHLNRHFGDADVALVAPLDGCQIRAAHGRREAPTSCVCFVGACCVASWLDRQSRRRRIRLQYMASWAPMQQRQKPVGL